MRIIQTYVQGSRHISKGQPCEDRTFAMTANGVTAIALADGAGNARYTHAKEGAQCVTETISRFLCNNFDRFYDMEDIPTLQQTVISVCRKALSETAEKIGLESIDCMASTLLAVAVKEDRVIACHLGDGVIGCMTPKGIQTLSKPTNGEFANLTYFVTAPDVASHLVIKKIMREDAFAYCLMSDGGADYLYDDVKEQLKNAAGKFIFLGLQEDGEKKLEEIIRTKMVEPDPTSDDCSFISMLMEEKVPENLAGPEEIKEPEEPEESTDPAPEIELLLSGASEDKTGSIPDAREPIQRPQDEYRKALKHARRRRGKVLLTAGVLCVCLLAGLIGGIAFKGHQTDGEVPAFMRNMMSEKLEAEKERIDEEEELKIADVQDGLEDLEEEDADDELIEEGTSEDGSSEGDSAAGSILEGSPAVEEENTEEDPTIPPFEHVNTDNLL